MIPVPSGVHVWMATGHTDMRKGFDGLALLVQEKLKRDPHDGHLFVFRGRRGSLIKVLWHDGQGICLFAKRLERGRFIWPSPADGTVTITPAQLGSLRKMPFTTLRRLPKPSVAERSVPERLTTLDVPVLVIFGAADPRWEPSSVHQYDVVPNARVEQLPGVGHLPMFEAPGPNFMYIKERLRREYYDRWLWGPTRLEPMTKMPTVYNYGKPSPLAEILDGDSGKQIDAIWNYLLLGDKIKPPPQ